MRKNILFLHLVALFTIFFYHSAWGQEGQYAIRQDADSGAVTLQEMCRNQPVYSPYILYSNFLRNSFYFGVQVRFYRSDLKSYLGESIANNFLYRVSFNHTGWYLSNAARIYFGLLGEWASVSNSLDPQNNANFIGADIGVHLGLERDLGSKYFSSFLEVGPKIGSRAFAIKNSATGQIWQTQALVWGGVFKFWA